MKDLQKLLRRLPNELLEAYLNRCDFPKDESGDKTTWYLDNLKIEITKIQLEETPTNKAFYCEDIYVSANSQSDKAQPPQATKQLKSQYSEFAYGIYRPETQEEYTRYKQAVDLMDKAFSLFERDLMQMPLHIAKIALARSGGAVFNKYSSTGIDDEGPMHGSIIAQKLIKKHLGINLDEDPHFIDWIYNEPEHLPTLQD